MSFLKSTNRLLATALLSLLYLSASHFANAQTASHESSTEIGTQPKAGPAKTALSIEQQIAILEGFYAKQETGLDNVRKVLPEQWLNAETDWDTEKRKLQADAQRLNSESDSPEEAIQQKLNNAKLVWLMFSQAERDSIIGSAKAKQTSKTAHESAQRTLENAGAALRVQEKQLQEVQQDLANSADERRTRLLTMRLDAERQLETIAQRSKSLGEAQAAFSLMVSDWKEQIDAINSSFEDEYFLPGTRDFTHYRAQLRERMIDSNLVVSSEHAFARHYLGADNQLPDSVNITAQVRETDTPETVELINTLLNKRIELSHSEEDYTKNRNLFLLEVITWHEQYRKELTETRGKLIHQVIDSNAFSLNNFDPVAVELGTVYSTYLFSTWREPLIRSISQRKAIKFYQVTHLIKVALVAAFVIWLFLKRALIISSAKRWCITRSTNNRWRKSVVLLFGLLQELYIFFLLFVFADSLIKLTIGFGIDSAAIIKPALNQIILFFLFWGLISYVRPLLSLRHQAKQDNEAAQAIEEVFSLVPMVYLGYWVSSGVITTLLFHQLNDSLLSFHINNVLKIVSIVLLFSLIWVRRSKWRTINERAYSTELWQRISLASKRKPWEPIILLIGGGIGVYRVAWNMLMGHLKELELTRSFQAMVSRAILERQYRKTTMKLFADRFPDKYWRNFHFQTPAETHWYVRREGQEAQMEQAYRDWSEKGIPTRMFLCGDRGIGKSELIANFLRTKKVDCSHTYISTGETSVAAMCRRLSISYLNTSIETPDALIAELLKLEPHTLCIENLENTILRKVGGFEAFSTVVDIILQTSTRHLWIATCTNYAWSIIKHGVTGAECFTDFIYVQGMDEASLAQAMLSRHSDAHMNEPNFKELNLETSTKHRNAPTLSEAEINAKGRELYFRILWDYTKGNPRQALYYWKASLSWSDDACTVHLFEIPEHKVLETLQDRALMLLAGLLEHNGLTLEGMQDVMNCSANTVRRLIEELSPYGIVFNMDSEGASGWHVESFWTRAVENYLEKRQLLFRSAE